MPSKLDEYLVFGKPSFGPEETAAVTRVLESGWVGMGQETLMFEDELANYIGSPNVVSVNSCTSALFLSLLALGIGPGDEVICPSLTWCATANAAVYLGATPVFADVDPNTLSISFQTISACLSERTKAVMVVHFGGYAVDVAELRSQLPDSIHIIEDAAHALGAYYPNGSPVGSAGNLTCFSFYANKNLSTGEGGAIALGDTAIANELRSLRQSGMPVNAWNRFIQPKSVIYSTIDRLGYKMNFLDLNAAIGRVQLRRQSEFAKTRLEVANAYFNIISEAAPDVRFQSGVTDPKHARHLVSVVLPEETMRFTRDEFIVQMRALNVGASVHYAPLHLMPLYQSRARCPVAEALHRSIVTLPISASMSATQAEMAAICFLDVLARAIAE